MTIVTALADQPSVVDAWKTATSLLRHSPHRSCTNLIYAITDPLEISVGGLKTIALVNAFAGAADIGDVTTVANTIFPLDMYLKSGTEGLYNDYPNLIYPRVKTAWGNYFDRLIRRRDLKRRVINGPDGTPINPLASIVEKIGNKIKSGHGTLNHYEMVIADEGYELTTYLAERDSKFQRGGPCLSHLSFKIDDKKRIRLTAVYRSHYYLERALGNLVGLARLQAFVAAEVGAEVGPLTCHAVHATLVPSLPNASSDKVTKLLDDCGIK
jgi:hypothetical protein